MATIGYVGIMYAPNSAGDDFPTLKDACAAENGPNLFMHDLETFGGWRVIANNPRTMGYADADWEAMDETNYAALVDALIGERLLISRGSWSTPDTYVNIDVADYAVIEGVLMLNPAGPNYPENLDKMVACAKRLDDYPLLDEDAYSEREYEAWNEWAPTAWRDELRDAAKAGRYGDDTEETIDALEAVDVDAILGELSHGLHYNSGFTGEYGPNFLEILDEWLDPDTCPDWARQYADRVRALLDGNGNA